MRGLVFFFIYITGIHRILRYLNRRKLTILLYHGVDRKRNWGIYNYRGKFIELESFERQIKYLKKNYSILKLDKAIEHLKNKQKLPVNPLVITFDDGYKNIYDFAYSIIKNYQVVVTVFLSTDFIEKQNPLWTDRLEYAINKCRDNSLGRDEDKIKYDKKMREKMKALPEDEKNAKLKKIEEKCGNLLNDFFGEKEIYAPLDWKEILEMKKEGIEFANHGKSHAILTKIPKKQADREIKESKNLLEEKIGKISKIFSYPNGQENDFNEEIKKMVKEAGFVASLTTIPGFNDFNSDLFSLKRITMDGTDNFAEFIMTISGIKSFLQKIKIYAKRSRIF